MNSTRHIHINVFFDENIMHVKALFPAASKGSYLTILLKNRVINYHARKYCSGTPLLQLLYVGSSTPVVPVVPM